MPRRIFSWRPFLLYLIVVALISIPFLSLGTRAVCTLGIERNRTTPVETGRSLISESSSLNNLWNIHIFLPYNGLQIVSPLLIASDTRCNEVIGFDFRTGARVWSAEIGRPQHITVDHDRDRLYVSGQGPYLTQLVALDIQSGNVVWQNASLTGQRVGIFQQLLPNSELYVDISGNYLPVDAETGEFGSAIEFNYSDYGIADGRLWRVEDGRLEAIVTQNREINWVSNYENLAECCLYQIDVVDEKILLGFAENLVALDETHGDLLWEISSLNPASNFVANDNFIFILNDNATLLVLDMTSGRIVENIQFAYPQENSKIFNDEMTIHKSWLVMEDQLLGIYWSDLNLLSVYERD